jgi:hypothetical protein
MNQTGQSLKTTLVRDYQGVAKKYLHERETADALLNLAIGSSGGPMHHGITGESAMLMRFRNYDREANAFTLRSEGPVGALLLEWDPLPGTGGVECRTTPLTLNPALQLENVAPIRRTNWAACPPTMPEELPATLARLYESAPIVEG